MNDGEKKPIKIHLSAKRDSSNNPDRQQRSFPSNNYPITPNSNMPIIKKENYLLQIPENYSNSRYSNYTIIDDDDAEEPEYEESGVLLHLYTGSQNPAENFTFRRICMRYGLQAWDEMNTYLPWRQRPDLRMTLMKMIKKQAISEYSRIKADPAVIHDDNINLDDENYIFKGGVYINQRYDLSSSERADVRNAHAERYDLATEESLNVNIIPIMNVDYIQQKMKMRKLSLHMFRAALLLEQGRRKGESKPRLGLEGVSFLPSRKVRVKRARTKLKWGRDTESYIFEKKLKD
ncbi:hypothetical protein TRFO_39313 [Tritrichomonas foetus]|uniref:Uncharacterized protein n=1 Tax=Tritrichomonas foetus TaxID=1144522 RepID=A0A1J4JA64_9EUKA|nr:hypothetical protein TRFO_39313 [Tritrichomonas foetus]|eukprot:OHS94523.1 hypothetical protein TRFO_39313 [Tritrichomonas foetus]